MSILDRIRAHGGDLTRDGYNFRLQPGRLSKDAIHWLQSNMDAAKCEVWPLYEEWQERAAIMEHDGELSRAQAEAAAYEQLEGSYARAA